ncbi:uncharacterized protein LOC106050387 isoform X2 [Biomphalaria glabrata]|uniref:Uncharacterized protein LOC106050387 isoform X2 n=1 Tax=Biomphalaria glabrata TaxID=6526 RepID=A0A9W2YDQ5_BIOGL|nr:uncharacterized protein LOC106050387 isoform X2 [Biomphalaria glabrata]
MRTLEEFAAIKSCPELFHFANSISDLLKPSLGSQGSLLLRAHSYPLLSDAEFEASSDDVAAKTMTTATDDNIEILSCHVEQEDEEFSIPCQSSLVPFKLANGESLSDDRTISQRKRVVRAVGAVTFLLLLFSIILIGISLNMSKNIDEMVRQSTLSHRQPASSFNTRKENLTRFDRT